MRAEEMPQWIALFEELGKADPNVTGNELDGRDTAKVVRVRDGERIVTDGPFRGDEGDPRRRLPHRPARPRRGDPARRAHPGREARARSRSARSCNNGSAGRRRAGLPRGVGSAVAILTRVLGDLELAEDAVQDAFATALERWPRDGVPADPAPGSSRPRATVRSTGSGARRSSSRRPSSSAGSRSSRPRRTT